MSAGGGRRRKGGHEEEHENHERWLVSYSDMMTVLMALFVVLYAISQVDVDKYEALRGSLAAGFNAETPAILPDGGGVLPEDSQAQSQQVMQDITPDAAVGVMPESVIGEGGPQDGAGDADGAALAAAEAEWTSLNEVRDMVAAALEEKGARDSVDFRITEEGLVIGMITSDVFFASASNDLTKTSRVVVDAIAPPLRKIPNGLSIEGHADVVPTGSREKTNWELSSARATTVLRRLVEQGDIKATRTAAVGFGDAQPLISKTDPKSLAANRRVDVVVLSSAPERVRELLPVVEQSRS
jgi:chemotaxis protein MotB